MATRPGFVCSPSYIGYLERTVTALTDEVKELREGQNKNTSSSSGVSKRRGNLFTPVRPQSRVSQIQASHHKVAIDFLLPHLTREEKVLILLQRDVEQHDCGALECDLQDAQCLFPRASYEDTLEWVIAEEDHDCVRSRCYLPDVKCTKFRPTQAELQWLQEKNTGLLNPLPQLTREEKIQIFRRRDMEKHDCDDSECLRYAAKCTYSGLQYEYALMLAQLDDEHDCKENRCHLPGTRCYKLRPTQDELQWLHEENTDALNLSHN